MGCYTSLTPIIHKTKQLEERNDLSGSDSDEDGDPDSDLEHKVSDSLFTPSTNLATLMDTTTSLIPLIHHQTLPTSPSSPPESTITPPPDITNAPTADLPPPPLINSLNQLCGFSTALSDFLSCHEELRNHISFISSSIDSKLSGHLAYTTTTNPNLSPITNSLETLSNQTIVAVPEVVVSEQLSEESGSDYQRRHAIAKANERSMCSLDSDGVDTSKKAEVVDASEISEEVDVCMKDVEADTSKTEDIDISMKLEEIDTSKKPEEVDVLNSPEEIGGSMDTEEIDASEKCDDIGVSMKLVEIDVLRNRKEIDALKTHAETDIWKKPEESVVEISFAQTTTVTVVPVAAVSEKNPNGMASDCEQNHENVRTPESLEEINMSNNPEQIDIPNKPGETDILTQPEQAVIDASEISEGVDTSIAEAVDASEKVDTSKTEDIDISMKLEEIDTSKKPEEVDVSNNPEEIDASKKAEIVDTSSPSSNRKQIHNGKRYIGIRLSKWHGKNNGKGKWGVEVREPGKGSIIWVGSYFSSIAAARAYDIAVFYFRGPTARFNFPDLIGEYGYLSDLSTVSIQKKAKEVGAKVDALQKQSGSASHHQHPKNPEEVDVSNNPERIDVSNNRQKEIAEALKLAAETDTSKKSEATVEEISCAQTITGVPEALFLKQNPSRKTTNPKQNEKVEVVDINICNNPEESETANSKKSIISVLKYWCRKMSYKSLKSHVRRNFSDMNNRKKEIAEALKLAADPAKLVLDCIGKFFVRSSRIFRKESPENVARVVLVLILECFVMISGDGIEISKTEKEYAEQVATDWRDRMIKGGGLGQTDEIDARGLLLYISGFGIRDDVFKIQYIVDLIRASNVKEISNALRASVFLIPKIPEVIDFMVKNNLEIEAADIAFTFGLEDVFHPHNILRTYLHNLAKDSQNGSSFQTLEAMKQHLCDLKSVKQCLEFHNIDPLVLLPDFEINVRIQNLERETNEGRLTEKRKFLDNPIHPEANAESMQKPVGHAETDSSKKSEATVPETYCARTIIAVSEADVSKQNPSKMTPRHKQTHEKNEVVDISKKPDTLKKPKESNIPENPEETETENSKKSAISVLESLCQNVSFKRLRKHVTTHFSEMNNRHKEIVKALKLNADPAKLVLYNIGKFFLQPSATFRKVTHQTVVRLALVLILECFVMTGSDGIEIANTEKEYAAETAAAWRNRMIKEGGLGHTDEVDARSLLLFISGFGIQDDVFKIQDIVDLIRASNVKGICTALRSSVFLIAKLPEVIDLLVKDNLQIDSVDIVYTFGLEDKCPPQNILRTYLHNLVKDIQNDSSLQTLEAMKQHLCDLKSVRRCLESHNVDPLVLLPDFEINVRIQNLERETNEGRITQKRKFLDNPIHPEANAESMQKPVGHAETDSSKNSEATVPETSCARTVIAVSEADVSKQNASRMTTRHKQTHEKNEVVDISKKPDTLKKPKESNIRENPEETETENSKKSAISVLESLCQKVYFKNLRKHVTTHFSELNSRHKEIVKALKLNANPAKLVLYNIGKFFLQPSATFRKVTHQTVVRLALVLILECFVMTSSDGIEIANTEKEYAAETVAAWRNRMIKEGGLGHTDEVDARGLLLFISGFGIQDDVFKIQDIVDLIRASNVKGISTALRSSVFLIAKLPEVIDLLVKDNLQIDAVDIAYTFGLEDKCYPRNILRTYLHNLVKDVQNDSSLQTLETRKQQLFNLKSIKQCLESHNVDPSILLPDFKVDEMIEYLARDVNIERTMIPKRKSLENPNHQEAKRSCFNHKDMPRPHKPVVGNHGMSLYNRSTQPSTHYNYSENIHGSVPNGPASGFPGSYDQVVRRADMAGMAQMVKHMIHNLTSDKACRSHQYHFHTFPLQVDSQQGRARENHFQDMRRFPLQVVFQEGGACQNRIMEFRTIPHLVVIQEPVVHLRISTALLISSKRVRLFHTR